MMNRAKGNRSLDSTQPPLNPRANDERLLAEELQSFSLFAKLIDPSSIGQLINSVILRKYSKGDIICHEAEPGGTAFYIVTSEDLYHFFSKRLETARSRQSSPVGGQSLQQLAASIQQLTDMTEHWGLRMKQLPKTDNNSPCYRHVATASVRPDSSSPPKRTALLKRMGARFFKSTNRPSAPLIANDGPCDLDGKRRSASLYEGEVFGEQSCGGLSVRTATVVAEEDCYLLEMQRDFFLCIQSLKGYRKQVDEVYRRRTLTHHLSQLDLLAGANEQDIEWIADRAELLLVRPGSVLCEEHSTPDAMYVVRNGRVDVVTGLDLALTATDVADWQTFCQELIPENQPNNS